MCCSVLQCIHVFTRRGGNALFLYVYVLWCVAVRCSVLQYVAVCCSAYMYSHGREEIRCSRMYIFICVAVRCSASQCVAIFKCMGGNMLCSRYFHVYNNKINVLHTTDSLEECVAVCCRALQCVAVCCSVVQCIHTTDSLEEAMRCNVLQMCCSVLHVCCRVLHVCCTCVARVLHMCCTCVAEWCGVSKSVAMCCGAFQHAAACYVVQYVAV